MKLDQISSKWMQFLSFDIRIEQKLSSTHVIDYLEHLFSLEPEITPERFDPYDPVRTKYSPGRFRTLSDSNRIESNLMIHGPNNSYTYHRMSGDDDHERWNIDFDITQITIQTVFRVSDRVVQFPIALASLHTLSKQEFVYLKAMMLASETHDGGYFSGLCGPMVGGLPTLAWRTYFGPMYIRHFGKDRLLSAPAFSVKEIHPEVISLQLTETIQTIDTDWQQFHAVRLKVIEHLGAESFQRPRGPNDPPKLEHEYPNMPAKSIPPELAPLRKKMDENTELERQKTRPHPQIESIDEMLQNPKRFRVASQLVNKNQPERFVIDDYREEFIRFPDAETRNRVADQLIQAGAFFQDIAKYQGWTRVSKPLPAVDGPVPASDKQKYNTRLLKNIT